MKTCIECNIDKNEKEFHRSQTKKDGLNSYCKSCANEISKKWYVDNKHKPEVRTKMYESSRRYREKWKTILNNIKSEIGCYVCQEKNCHCLDFHHLSQETKVESISVLLRKKSSKKIREELYKCICLCSNCHRKLHFGVFDLYWTDLTKIKSYFHKIQNVYREFLNGNDT